MTADQAAKMLVNMMADNEVPFGVRAKIAQDLVDRAGLVAAQVHKIVPITDDPVIAFFEGLLSDPSNWVENPPQPAIEERVIDPDAELVEAEIVEPEGELANDTPPQLALDAVRPKLRLAQATAVFIVPRKPPACVARSSTPPV